MKEVNIYVGAYLNFFGIGAYGALIEDNGLIQEISGCSKYMTEHRIRLWGVIAALCSLPESCEVTLYTDSEYVINGINQGWAERWEILDWTIRTGEKAKNNDLWKKFIPLIHKHNINFVLILCHNGFEYGAEYFKRCDELAKEAIKRA